jgi:hypothetical protein
MKIRDWEFLLGVVSVFPTIIEFQNENVKLVQEILRRNKKKIRTEKNCSSYRYKQYLFYIPELLHH